MDLYTYVATSNPYQAKAILHKYGYSMQNVRNESDLGVCLRKLVAYEGEGAFSDILDSHPDKNVIVEMYGNKTKLDGTCKNGQCDCSSCKAKEIQQYLNFSGTNETTNKSIKEFSIYILSAALLLAAAIISKK